MSKELREEFEQWFFCPSNSLLAEWEDAAWEAFQAGADWQRTRAVGVPEKVAHSAQWPTTPGLSARPSDDDLWDQTLSERDSYHESADKLTDAIAKHFGQDFGEHSNLNAPWENALEFVRSLAAQSSPDEPEVQSQRAQPSADPWAPSGADYDRSIHHNPDAKAWADFFVATFPGLSDKHDLMLSWFANAMMAMHDWIKSQSSAAQSAPAGEREAVEVVARLMHWKGRHPNPWKVVARMYSECAADAYPNEWEEGAPLMTVAQHNRILAAWQRAAGIPAEKPVPELMMASYHEAIGWNACRQAMLAAAPAQPAAHPDDAAVDRFATAMKAKLAKSREKGRHGWQNASAAHLSSLLYRHVYKADPLDVANLAMMLHQNGQAIELPHEARHEQGDEVRRLRKALQITRDTIDAQLEVIASRAPGNYLDKLPVVRSLKAHRARCDAALAASTGQHNGEK